jgi:L-ascorbate metabolism protein UlaG (beta-lactamase superfamily)
VKLRNKIGRQKVPKGSIALWWLGQSGFICKSPGGSLLAIDPYLSNACKAVGDKVGINMDRMVPPPLHPRELVGIDAYVMTHSHEDHLDPDTLHPYRAAGGAGPFVAPPETVEKLHGIGVPQSETMMIWPNKSYVFRDFTLRATFAIPFGGDDMNHLGYLLKVNNGPTVYFTGDTQYHEILAACVITYKPDVLVTVINPFGNMDPGQAARLAKDIDAKIVIPCHYDLFPDNSLPPRLLRSNLLVFGIGDRYRELAHGKVYVYPEKNMSK